MRLLKLGHVTSVDTVVDVSSLVDRDAALEGSARADGQGEVRVLIADHGSDVVWGVVGSGASGHTSRAGHRNAGRVAGVILHGWNNLHTASSEGVAVDVGQVIGDLAVSPGELELRDWSIGGLVGRKLDRDSGTLVGVALAVSALKLSHGGVAAASY